MDSPDRFGQKGPSESRSNAGPSGKLRAVAGSRDIYYDPQTGNYYQRQLNPDWKWGSKVPQYVYKELTAPPGGTAYMVGEGDFSYSRAYAKQNPTLLLKATSYDPLTEVKQYPQGPESLGALGQSDYVAVEHGVNVMLSPGSGSGAMSPRPVDLLQFNFPHTGTGSGSAEVGSPAFTTFVTDNQNLLRGFFRNAQAKVAPGGQLKLTYKKQGPYLHWKVEDIAKEEGWEVEREEPFVAPEGYQHVLTKTASGEVGNDGAVTVTFRRANNTNTLLSQAVDADDLSRRLSALPQATTSGKPQPLTTSSSPGKAEKPALTTKTSYFKENILDGWIYQRAEGRRPGIIRYYDSQKKRREVLYYDDAITTNPGNVTLTQDTRVRFVIKDGKAKKIEVVGTTN